MTPSEIEPATFWFVAQHLNHCATAVPEAVGIEVFSHADKNLASSLLRFLILHGKLLNILMPAFDVLLRKGERLATGVLKMVPIPGIN